MTTTQHGPDASGLSPDDVLVLDLLAHNTSRSEIARRLRCSTATVDRRVSRLREHWDVETTVEVVVHAVRAGVI